MEDSDKQNMTENDGSEEEAKQNNKVDNIEDGVEKQDQIKSDTSASSSESDDDEDKDHWRTQSNLTHAGMSTFMTRIKTLMQQDIDERDIAEEIQLTSLNKDDANSSGNGNCASPGSAGEVFQECISDSFDGLEGAVAATEKEQEESEDMFSSVPAAGTLPKSSTEEEQERFCKNVPLDASVTWDFSLQALDKDFKSKVLWLEGSFYPKFVGKCLHEMQNVPCECDEKKKVSVCRLCHAVFCSNKCFKRAIKIQTGETDDADEDIAVEPELSQEAFPNLDSGVEAQDDSKLTTTVHDELTITNENVKLDTNVKTIIGKNDRSIYQRESKSPQSKKLVHPDPIPDTANTLSSSLWPTQVHISNAFNANANQSKLCSPIVPIKSLAASGQRPGAIKDPPTKILRNPGPPLRIEVSEGEKSSHQIQDKKDYQPQHISSSSCESFYTAHSSICTTDENDRLQNDKTATSNNSFPSSPVGNVQKQMGKCDDFIAGRNLQLNGHSVCRNFPLGRNLDGSEEMYNPSTKNGVSHPHKNYMGGGSGKYGQHQKGNPIFYPTNFRENYGPGRNQANFPLNQSSHNDDSHKRRDNKPEFGGWRNNDNFPSHNNFFRGHPFHSHQSPLNRNGGFTEVPYGLEYSQKHSSKTIPPNYSNRIKNPENEVCNLNLPTGVLMPVQYIRGKNFYDFSVMTFRNLDKFRSLQKKLQSCNKRRMNVSEYKSLCILKFRCNGLEDSTEEEWYRGRIIKLIPPQVGIYFIDLGIEATVKSDAIYDLPDEFSYLLPLAIRIRSLNVKVDINDPEVSEQFDTVVRDRVVKIQITHKDKKGLDRYGAYVNVEHIGKWFDAGVLLKKFQIGEQVTPEEIHYEEKQNFIIPFSTYLLPDQLLPVTKGKDAQQMYISHVVSPNEFYIITKHSNQARLEVEANLNPQMVRDLERAKRLTDLAHPLFLWTGQNGLRARVKVLEVIDKPTGVEIVVQKVDHGEVMTVPLQSLLKLPDKLLVPSSCAYKCSLPIKPVSKTRNKNKSSYDEVTKFLHQMKDQRPYYFKVFSVEQPNIHFVDLFMNPSPVNGCSADFVKKGWADFSQNFTVNVPND